MNSWLSLDSEMYDKANIEYFDITKLSFKDNNLRQSIISFPNSLGSGYALYMNPIILAAQY